LSLQNIKQTVMYERDVDMIQWYIPIKRTFQIRLFRTHLEPW